jgi:hypothetical protein
MSGTDLSPTLAALARRFEHFAASECHGYSPLYERLARGVARDPALLALAAHAPMGQPVPNLLLGAVQFLLLAGVPHPLGRFYPSVVREWGVAPAVGDPLPAFRAFCADYSATLTRLVETRLVQTNEVRRCGCLLPAFGLVARAAGERALALVEIGTSAGLNLLWDRYGYDYGAGRRVGDPRSPVQIACAARGPLAPALPSAPPRVGWRVGLDLAPVDVRDADAARWLQALVWPEHEQRAELLQHAVAVVRAEPPLLRAGDGLDLLPGVLAEAPAEAALCVYHTWMLNQVAPTGHERLAAILGEWAGRRELFHIGIEQDGDGPYPTLSLAAGGGPARTLARCHSHGEWIEWLDRDTSSSK